ncbi:MAG: phosphotransferase [Bacteroidota bacterium]
MSKYSLVPGRGLVTKQSTKLRIDFLTENGFIINNIPEHSLEYQEIRNKIESFIGSVEIPLGLVGPLTYNNNGTSEVVYALAGTLEGALVASMNRGAKAISLCDGFHATFINQRMVRAPMFLFESNKEAKGFSAWINRKFDLIKYRSEMHSNHAELIELEPTCIEEAVHIKFIYSTCDASGQNMTTICTWNAIKWIVNHYNDETGIAIKDFVIEGNGACDKKVSNSLLEGGRGICVEAKCFLTEKVVNRILRTTSEKMQTFYDHSVKMTKKEGMMGYNINVANAIAAIFVATGQDLGSIHESSLGWLSVEKKNDGIELSLLLPSLVIGSIGGGTNLLKQREALELMGCYGKDKVERFAELIAGFSLALEISTFGAVVSGEFAKAHEKLGRNKPIDHLVASEIDLEFVKSLLKDSSMRDNLDSVFGTESDNIENGILTALTARTNKKLMGFIPMTLNFNYPARTEQALLKSKGQDIDVMNGLHLMASSIDLELADLIFEYQGYLEYKNCHQKELLICEALSQGDLHFTPKFYGKLVDEQREIYLFLMEHLQENELLLLDSENQPHLWKPHLIKTTISAIHSLHSYLDGLDELNKLVPVFDAKNALPLYSKLLSIVENEEEHLVPVDEFKSIREYLTDLKEPIESLDLPLRIIHNDFNPRNIGIRKDNNPVVYDWELAVRNFPHRDIVEFLSFVLPTDFKHAQLFEYLHFHYKLFNTEIEWEQWKKGYIRALKEYLLARVLFYKAADIHMNLKFPTRVFQTTFEMIKALLCHEKNAG